MASANFPTATDEQTQAIRNVQCCIAGGGPAGVMLGLLLARRGVEVLVLEKHHDFLRDFRGDTIHPSTMQIMSELGLADQLLQLPHTKEPQLFVQTAQERLVSARFDRLKTRWPYIVFLPQWDFLNFLADKAGHYPGFHLLMDAEARELIEEQGVVRGIRYEAADGWHEVYASLTVAADGRTSRLRTLAGLQPLEMSPPMDVLWFRLARHEGDPDHSSFSLASGHVIGLINRSTYWQVAYIIPKGTEQHVREVGLEQLKRSLCAQKNWMQDRIDELQSWEQIKLLVVQSNRLTRWYRPGLLCIGDAAHAMTPVGGVGINLAIQDAVVAANILAVPLKRGQLRTQHLAVVQRRREWPTRIIQLLQTTIQKRLAGSALSSPEAAPVTPLTMGVLRVLNRLNLPARLIGFGVWPAHVKS